MGTCQSNREAIDESVWKSVCIYGYFAVTAYAAFCRLWMTKKFKIYTQTDSCPASCPKSARKVVSEDCIFYLSPPWLYFCSTFQNGMQSAKNTLPVCTHSCPFPSPQCRTTSRRAHTHTHKRDKVSSLTEKRLSTQPNEKQGRGSWSPSRWSSPRGSGVEATARHTHGLGPLCVTVNRHPSWLEKKGTKPRWGAAHPSRGRKEEEEVVGREEMVMQKNDVCRLDYNSNWPYGGMRLKPRRRFQNPGRSWHRLLASLGDSEQKHTREKPTTSCTGAKFFCAALFFKQGSKEAVRCWMHMAAQAAKHWKHQLETDNTKAASQTTHPGRL